MPGTNYRLAPEKGGVTLWLAPIGADADTEGRAEAIAPGFGGDGAEARAILIQTVEFLARPGRFARGSGFLRNDVWGPEGGTPCQTK